ncbi:MAG: hypothetical protein EP349_04765 [Alphaproteobacteria bacterium]|nr:MAG: hypothetical protein EP349_04765 [Alphaproteobacteria bacterium]
MTEKEPLYIFKTSVLRSDITTVRTALYLGGLFLAVTAMLLKFYLDINPLIFYLILAVAAVDVTLSVALVKLWALQTSSELRVYENGLAFYRNGRELWRVRHEEVKSVEIAPDMAEKDTAAGLVNLVLYFDPALRIEGANVTQLKLTGFAAADDPYGHIRPLLSK